MKNDPTNNARDTDGSCDGGSCVFKNLRFSHLGILVLVFGLLLWARFLLVTGHPRTALADPAEPSQARIAAPTASPTLPPAPTPGTASAAAHP